MLPNEQYTRIEAWLKRLEGLFQAKGEIWLVGDWNADYLKVGDDKYYNFTEEGLKAEADKIDWNKITERIACTEDLDRSTEHLEATIRYVIEKVALVKIVKKDPRYLGDWCTTELKERVTARNESQRKKKTKEKHRE